MYFYIYLYMGEYMYVCVYPKIRTTFIFPKSMTIGDTLSWHRS